MTPKNPKEDTAWLDELLGIELKDAGTKVLKLVNVNEAKSAILSHQTQYINSVLEGLLGELPDCENGCVHQDTHKGHNHVWWEGYNQAQAEVTKLIKEKMQ